MTNNDRSTIRTQRIVTLLAAIGNAQAGGEISSGTEALALARSIVGHLTV
jgi:hypothetical protein